MGSNKKTVNRGGGGKKVNVSNRGKGAMKLRSRSIRKQLIDQEASSRVQLVTPTKKRARCIFIDDEAVENDSNDISDEETLPLVTRPSVMTNAIEKNDINDIDSRTLDKRISLGVMSDVLSSFYEKRVVEPPPIPLCRLVSNEAIRKATSDVSWLVSSFDNAAYMENMGAFLVSIKGPHGEGIPVTAQDLDNWGPLWRQVNDKFEAELPQEWEDLKGMKFLIWDGNHRYKTWIKRIKEAHFDNLTYHVRVKCIFLNVEKRKEGELFLALDSTNSITRSHVKPTISHEIYMCQKFGIADKESILGYMSPEQRRWAEIEYELETRQNHAVRPWYNSPCSLISQLVWKEDLGLSLAREEARLKLTIQNGIEFDAAMDLATKKEHERLRDKGWKYLAIANPANGEEFFSLLYELKWDDKSMTGITKDKLYCLCTSKVSAERKREILTVMSLTKAKDPQASHFADYKKFREYMRKETYWTYMYEESCLITRMLEIEGPELPKTFEAFFKMQRRCHIHQTFTHLLTEIKSSADSSSMPELQASSKRLVYRWLRDCLAKKDISMMPMDTLDWTQPSDDGTMFSSLILERGITEWECEHCPWWIDYPIDVIPKQENALHKSFLELGQISVLLENIQSSTKGKKRKEKEKDTLKSKKYDRKGKDNKRIEDVTPSKDTTKKTSKKDKRTYVEEDNSAMSPGLSYVPESSMMVRGGLSSLPESTLGPSQRRPFTRQTSVQYTTVVDALLTDIEFVDDFARQSIKSFLSTNTTHKYSYHGAPSTEAARLIFADFPTSLIVDGLGAMPEEGTSRNIPDWNIFSSALVKGTMGIAAEFLGDEGFLVTLSLAEHFGKVKKYAGRDGLRLHRTWSLMCDLGYSHPVTFEEVCDLTIGLFYREDMPLPHYDREAGARICSTSFPATRSFFVESQVASQVARSVASGVPARGGAERTRNFFRWLLATFTDEKDYVIDVFAGCGGLGSASAEENRFCLCIEGDFFAYNEFLTKVVCGPSSHVDD